ncbi:MAG: sugar ABC transporter permease [Caldiserica bacterium]|nr:MAG: sugar ABC transporter permease [Caldisericota bacterium]
MSEEKVSKLKDYLTSYLFIIPAVLLFSVFSIYPIFKILQLSLLKWDGISLYPKFVGLKNFIEVIKDKIWWKSFLNAGIITLLALTVQNALALVLAIIVDKDIRAGEIYRVIFYIPPVLSGIVVGLIWNWIYNYDYGFLNHFLEVIGLGGLKRAWLSDPKLALFSVAVVHMWKGFGWGFIIFLAGLQTIPRNLYEAAQIDGATPWKTFLHVVVPMMRPVFFLVSILTILGTMQIYDIIVATTGGGPGYATEVPITRILSSMLGSSRFGYACAEGLIFGVVLLAVSLIQLRISAMMRNE